MGNNNPLVQAMMDVEYYPPSELVKMNIDITKAQKLHANNKNVSFPSAHMNRINYAKCILGQSIGI